MLGLFLVSAATVRSPRAAACILDGTCAGPTSGQCPPGPGGGAEFPVYYTGCDNGIDPGPLPPPPPPGCPTAATQTFSATLTVPEEPEAVDHQIIYFGTRVEYDTPDYHLYFISAGLSWNYNCSGRKWTANVCGGDVFCDHNSPLLDVSPGDVVTTSDAPPRSPAPEQATQAR